MPIYSALSLYGLSDRIGQYGWSISRSWALFIWAWVSLFLLGYVYQVIRHRLSWYQHLSRFNVFMGVGLILSLLLVNSPLVNFQTITLNSQLERLEYGKTTLEEMDFYYFKKLGIKGKQTLVELKARAEAEQKLIIVKKIDRLLADKKEITSLSKPELLSSLKGNVDINTIPKALSEKLYEDLNQKSWENTNTQNFYLFKLNLNLGADNKAEYLLVKELEHILALQVYFLENNIWKTHRMQTKNLPIAQEMLDVTNVEIGKANKNNEENKKPSEKALQIQALIKQNYQTVKPKWQQLEINGQRFEVME